MKAAQGWPVRFGEGDPGVSLISFDMDTSGGFYVLFRGGDGDDTLTSGLADDVMYAGAGADTFMFTEPRSARTSFGTLPKATVT